MKGLSITTPARRHEASADLRQGSGLATKLRVVVPQLARASTVMMPNTL